MERSNRFLLAVVLAAAAVITAVLGVGIVLITRPALEDIELLSVLIGSNDAEARLYGSTFSSGISGLERVYPEATELPPAANSGAISLRGSEKVSGTAWIWLYRDGTAADRLYNIMSNDVLSGEESSSGWSTTTRGELEQIGERASYYSYDANAPELKFRYSVDELILQRCTAVVRITMHDTDFTEVAAYAQRIDARIRRDVCGAR